MRANIKDIIKACNVTESEAEVIEQRINDNGMLDWSECTMGELIATARHAMAELNDEANRGF